MTALLDRTATLPAAGGLRFDRGPAATLDDLVSRAWERLEVAAEAACIVCGASMTAEPDHAARCGGCGSWLS